MSKAATYPSASSNYDRLDGIRGIAAQFVLLSHARYELFHDSFLPETNSFLDLLARGAVWAFFTLSGFVITASIAREIARTKSFSFFGYGIRRVARIYPPYIFAIVLSIAVANIAPASSVIAHAVPHPNSLWLAFRALVFAYHKEGAMPGLDIPVWSLRIEVGLYVIAAFAALATTTRGTLRASFCMVAIGLSVALCLALQSALLALLAFSAGGILSIYRARVPVAGFLFRPVQTTLGRIIIAPGAWSYTLYIIHYPLLWAIELRAGALIEAQSVAAKLAIAGFVFVAINAVAWALALYLERSKEIAHWLNSVLLRIRKLAI